MASRVKCNQQKPFCSGKKPCQRLITLPGQNGFFVYLCNHYTERSVMTKRFLILGGDITMSDGSKTYMDAKVVGVLYKLNPEECIFVDRDDKNHDYFKLTKAKWDEKYGEQTTFRPDPTGRYQLPKGVR